jgi:catechol 2,3-dioxygenase-like lactoylglutathione lyase family enzyme
MTISVQSFHHFSFTAGDLEAVATFYARFGFTIARRFDSIGPEVDEGADVEDADMDIIWMEHPQTPLKLEFIRYVRHAAGRSAHNSEVGAAHLCMVVDDVVGAYEELSSEGITFLSPPHQDGAGVWWVYLRDPDGNALELNQLPPS